MAINSININNSMNKSVFLDIMNEQQTLARQNTKNVSAQTVNNDNSAQKNNTKIKIISGLIGVILPLIGLAIGYKKKIFVPGENSGIINKTKDYANKMGKYIYDTAVAAKNNLTSFFSGIVIAEEIVDNTADKVISKFTEKVKAKAGTIIDTTIEGAEVIAKTGERILSETSEIITDIA